jgi:23S rRNA pseudouridine1911/1915/1917 synthase
MAVSKSLLAKPAVTHYSRVANGMLDGKPVALLRCRLETGRTHQIRVHLQSIGFPLVGDTVYGKQHLAGVFPRQALHAERLALQHPANRESCEWTAALPADMSQLLARAGIDFTAA